MEILYRLDQEKKLAELKEIEKLPKNSPRRIAYVKKVKRELYDLGLIDKFGRLKVIA